MSLGARLRALVGSAIERAVEAPREFRNPVADPGVAPLSWQISTTPPISPFGRIREAVGDSDDLARILALPRRMPKDIDGEEGQALADMMTARLAKPRPSSCRCASLGLPCITRLKPAQAWALYEAPLAGGLLANIGVGSGKTGLDILAAMVIPGCRRAVLFVPSNLVPQLETHYQAWSEHWHVPSLVIGPNKAYIVPGAPIVKVVAISRFQRADATTLLEQERPDLVIVDEIQRFKNPDGAGTSRFLRYMGANPSTRLVGWSGTITDKSILEYAHLIAFALKAASPVPLDPEEAKAWALAIDPSDWPAPMGALIQLCRPGEHVHSAYRRRLLETRGVIATKTASCPASMWLHERKPPKMPAELAEHLRVLRTEKVRPDGEELVDPMQVAACARQLACGFYYRWRYPRGESPELIDRWFLARKLWHRELRAKLERRAEHLDSPLNCAKAAIRHYAGYEGDLPTWESEFWPAWRDIRAEVKPVPAVVRVDDFLARDAAEWARKGRGVVWYEFDAFGEWVAELSGLTQYGAGDEAKADLKAATGKESVICSIRAHGTGHDGLQFLFSECLVANPPGSGLLWQQLLGRQHRQGQTADEVHAYVYRHTPEMRESLETARRRSSYAQGTLGSASLILDATCDF